MRKLLCCNHQLGIKDAHRQDIWPKFNIIRKNWTGWKKSLEKINKNNKHFYKTYLHWIINSFMRRINFLSTSQGIIKVPPAQTTLALKLKKQLKRLSKLLNKSTASKLNSAKQKLQYFSFLFLVWKSHPRLEWI